MALSYLTTASSTSSLATYTFNSQSIGTAVGDRYIVVAVYSRVAGTYNGVTGITINGEIAYPVWSACAQDDGNSNDLSLWYYPVPTGTTCDVVVYCETSMLRCAIALWSITGIGDIEPYSMNVNTNNGTSVSMPLNVPAGGHIISAVGASFTAASASWSNNTSAVASQFNASGFLGGASSVATTKNTNLSVGWSNSTSGMITGLAVVFMTKETTGYHNNVRGTLGVNQPFCLAVSRDGTQIVINSINQNSANPDDPVVFASSDGGTTWRSIYTPYNEFNNRIPFQQMAVSNDGQYMYGIAFNSSTPSGYIFVSSDAGVTWTQKTSVSQSNDCLDCSANGQYVFVGGWAGYLFSSSDYGATWTQRTATTNLAKHALACSSDGQYVIVGNVSSGWAWKSSDFGVNWTQQTAAGQRNWQGANISDDGQKIAMAVSSGQIYYSTNGGTSYTAAGSSLSWVDLKGSSNGTYLLAAANTGIRYVSTNSGASWAAASSNPLSVGTYTSDANDVDDSGNLYVADIATLKKSTNSGSSWASLDDNLAAGADVAALATSPSGEVVLTNGYSGYLRKSTDYGQRWSTIAPSYVRPFAISSDGQYVVGVYTTDFSNYYVATSSNGGTSFTNVTAASANGVDNGCMSDDGSIQYVVRGPNILKSTNYGSSFSTLSQTGSYFIGISCSSDGQYVYAADGGPGYVYVSSNSGTSFTQKTSVGSQVFWTVSCSPSGKYAILGGWPASRMYYTSDFGATWTATGPIFSNAADGINVLDSYVTNDGEIFVAMYPGVSNASKTTAVMVSDNAGSTWRVIENARKSAYYFGAGRGGKTIVTASGRINTRFYQNGYPGMFA